jgi:hypothetical protein
MEEDNLTLIQRTQTDEEEYEKLQRQFKTEELEYLTKCAPLRENRERLEKKKKVILVID